MKVKKLSAEDNVYAITKKNPKQIKQLNNLTLLNKSTPIQQPNSCLKTHPLKHPVQIDDIETSFVLSSN